MMAAQLQEAGRADAAISRESVSAQDKGTINHAESSSSEAAPLRNRSGATTSPYVRSLAETPILWQLLDDEAIRRAKSENKLIFLHIGFLACHYCRLTKQDSFSNPAIASLLNESFIPIAVDREERPDIDAVYWNYIQLVQTDAGWPINVFLTPQLQPVFGGTYWPGPGSETRTVDGRRSGEERLDLLEILRRLKKTWTERESQCRAEAEDAVVKLHKFAAEGTQGIRGLGRQSASTATTSSTVSAGSIAAPRASQASNDLELDLDQLEEAYNQLQNTFDSVNGGFGFAPKFITPAKFSFLLSLAHFPKPVEDVVGEREVAHATEMALTTLRKIRDGGLHDHAGAGFARFSLTEDWAFPRFEKMVADNALLLALYLDAWLHVSKGALAKDDEFADVVRELADYFTSAPICRDNGGFATSEAADSYVKKGDRHMREGAYYVWTRKEFEAVVGDEGTKADVARIYWNVLDYGNIRDDEDISDQFISQNILYVTTGAERLGPQLGISAEEMKTAAQRARKKLAAHREKERVRPPTDEKIVTCYNGMIISGLARTGAALKHGGVDPDEGGKYITAAEKAAGFIQDELWDAKEGVLYRIYHNGRGNTRGFADDYAYLIQGILDLYEATTKAEWLDWAKELQKKQINLFYDHPDDKPQPVTPMAHHSANGAFYSTEDGAPYTILRLKDGMDTSQPSTNGVSVLNLFRLSDMLSDKSFNHLAKETINAFEAEMLQHPWLFPTLLSGVVTAKLGSKLTVIANADSDVDAEKMRKYFTTPRAGSRSLVYRK